MSRCRNSLLSAFLRLRVVLALGHGDENARTSWQSSRYLLVRSRRAFFLELRAAPRKRRIEWSHCCARVFCSPVRLNEARPFKNVAWSFCPFKRGKRLLLAYAPGSSALLKTCLPCGTVRDRCGTAGPAFA